MSRSSVSVVVLLLCHASAQAGLHVAIDKGIIVSGDRCEMAVSGNWSNHGTFAPGNGTVLFNGDQKQTISGPGAEAMHNMVVNNRAGVYLACSLRIGGTLKLQQGNLHPEKHWVAFESKTWPHFTCLANDTVILGKAFGYKVAFENPMKGTVSFTYPQSNPHWLQVGPDTLWGLPTHAGMHTIKVILAVNEVDYDTLELKVMVLDPSAVGSFQADIPAELDLLAQASTQGIDFTVLLDLAGDFGLSVYDMVGRKVWEFNMLDALPGQYHSSMTFEKPYARTSGMYLVFLKHQQRQIARKVWLVR